MRAFSHVDLFLWIGTAIGEIAVNFIAGAKRPRVKTPTYRVFMGTKMSPRATIVDSRAFYKADVSIELSKIEFSHSLGRIQTFQSPTKVATSPGLSTFAT